MQRLKFNTQPFCSKLEPNIGNNKQPNEIIKKYIGKK